MISHTSKELCDVYVFWIIVSYVWRDHTILMAYSKTAVSPVCQLLIHNIPLLLWYTSLSQHFLNFFKKMRIQGSFWACVQPMGGDITIDSLSLAEHMHKMITGKQRNLNEPSLLSASSCPICYNYSDLDGAISSCLQASLYSDFKHHNTFQLIGAWFMWIWILNMWF